MNADINLLVLGLLQLALSVVLGVAILYVNYHVLMHRIGERHGMGTDNTAFAVFCASLLFSVGYLLSGLIRPILTTARLLGKRGHDMQDLVFLLAGHVAVYLLIGLVVSVAANAASVYLYTSLTHVKEFEALKKNNVAVAVVTGSIIVTMALLVRDAMVLMVEAFLPYPEVPEVY